MKTGIKTEYFVTCAFLTAYLGDDLNSTSTCLTPKPTYRSGKKLSVYPIKVLSSLGPNACFKECRAHGGCLSANFDNQHFICQLLSQKETYVKPLTVDGDFVHMELPKVSNGRDKKCGGVSCNNYSTCKLTTFSKRKCIETDCAEPLPALANGHVVKRTNNPITAKFGCNIGFTSVGSGRTIHCFPGGRWTSLFYRCELPVHGGWSSWGEWNTCSRTCGSGTKTRLRYCNNPMPMYEGNYCSGGSTNIILCNTNSCPIHGSWSSWSEWNTCSKSCGNGTKDRSRDCNNPTPMYGGDFCNGSSMNTTLCNTDECPSPIDGGWGSWGSWSLCTKTCDAGTKYRSRSCNNPYPQYGGAGCSGTLQVYTYCNTNVCPGWLFKRR
ncbi:A disintegrin and metalloproteinase with thrombospondin motifs adt-1-like [Saccostrea cucullata]|uniref:A disintegrin and metalloproteinase with thrombospondin motifs adt-1-like n=1 Tax=Saccostrea cuccullata TaxID=36930 RepID=UPI002ED15DC5